MFHHIETQENTACTVLVRNHVSVSTGHFIILTAPTQECSHALVIDVAIYLSRPFPVSIKNSLFLMFI
jgi:hypothetical protein